ncbi:ribbon-helix-helix protein, CopG family [Halomicrococcus sp. NG-SE-24]|uniref:ribbon-helix-helix protein, CopG family n=1 Tax=Halomicrococcus sp. NG-SE-24 TaxID=3436928 RepID=UPI003D991386
MDYADIEMEAVTIELTDEELEQIDHLAFTQHRDNSDAAIRDLLDEWLKNQK